MMKKSREDDDEKKKIYKCVNINGRYLSECIQKP